MTRETICSSAYFYGPYLVVRNVVGDLWEAFDRTGDCPKVAESEDPNLVDAKLRSLTPTALVK